MKGRSDTECERPNEQPEANEFGEPSLVLSRHALGSCSERGQLLLIVWSRCSLVTLPLREGHWVNADHLGKLHLSQPAESLTKSADLRALDGSPPTGV